ncbi:MAG TPA: HEAT repeat domain-containing protein [Anaerolineae bacterium]|nr:HEAT repeat domain-containing protein [Anaerolineae bacterium]
MKPLESTLQNLVNLEEPISVAALYALSGLEQAQLEQVKSVWEALPADRRAATMQHLVELGDENFEVDFNALYRVGLHDADPAVRAAAVSGLWEDADPALIAPLLNLLQTDDSEAVRAASASALGHYVYQGELEELATAKVAPIIAALKTVYRNVAEPIEVRRRALESLGFLSDDDTSQLITQAYQHANDRLKLSAVFAMGRSLDTDRWGSIVMEELAAPDPEMRYEAARAVGELEYAPAVRQLAELLDDVDEEVQLATVWSLGQIGGEKAKQLLMAVLESDVEHLHEQAEDALAELEFKADNLDFKMFDFDEDEDEEWVLDEDVDDEEDDDD